MAQERDGSRGHSRPGGRPARRPFGGGGRRRDPIFQTVADVDYKEIAQLRRCIDERGRILPRRRLSHSAEVQRAVAVAVKRARHCALLLFRA